MGRLTKPEDERASVQMGIRFTESERAQLDALVTRFRVRSAAAAIKTLVSFAHQAMERGDNLQPLFEAPDREPLLDELLQRVERLEANVRKLSARPPRR